MDFKKAVVLLPLLLTGCDASAIEICTIMEKVLPNSVEWVGSCNEGNDHREKTIPQMDKYQCMSPDNSQRVWDKLEDCARRCP